MPLPKISHPTYEVYLKSLDRKVKFRPFLVKEEKLLLMAKEGEDINEIIKTIKSENKTEENNLFPFLTKI